MRILGISAFYHDSAAVLLDDGRIVAAAQEERFTRRKHDPEFPVNAIRYCMAEGNVEGSGLDAVAFYDKPVLKFSRILKTHFSRAPRGLRAFVNAVPRWMKRNLWTPLHAERALEAVGVKMPPHLYFAEHHESHAASAFYPSPFETAAVLTIDGVGEWASSSIGRGAGNALELLQELRFPHSLGLLYSAFTYFTGFKVNSGEYKMMGLAPHGEPKYADLILDELVDLKSDGSFHLNMKYFDYAGGMRMANRRFSRLFGGPPRGPETEITQREMDMARSIQQVTEEIVLRMARHVHDLTGEKNLCMAGGVALNCVANGRVLRESPFEGLWIQPAAGDAGGALGAALLVWHHVLGNPRTAAADHDSMQGAYLGPAFADDEIAEFLETRGYPSRRLTPEERAPTIAGLVNEGHVVGLFDGRMEFGPRALGARSIIGDARSATMQSLMNLKIKHRESFRPFAPSCLLESCGEFFELDSPSPYMLLVAPIRKSRRIASDADAGAKPVNALRDRINELRSDVPAITHVDYTARVQTVDRETNERYHAVIDAFRKLTGYGVIVNTSFNVRGEPIVCTPEDAYRCFMRTEMDYLVLQDHLLEKGKQPAAESDSGGREDAVLD